MSEDVVILADEVSFSYDDRAVFRDFAIEISEGERVAIVGPSGCGKSTFLAMLGGHLQPDSGSLRVRGRPRTVHQRDGLFPWYTVRENLALAMGAEIHEDAQSRADRLVEERLQQWGLGEYGAQFPSHLSEGTRREVELACVLSDHSSILLLDEPFAILDALNRREMQRELLRFLEADRKLGEVLRTVVLVTHDVREAVLLCDRIIVMSSRPGRIVADLKWPFEADQEKTPAMREIRVQEIYRHLGV